MATQVNPLPLFLLSAVGGIVVPILDNILDLRTRGYLIYILTACTPTGVFFLLRLSSDLFSLPSLSSLFSFFGTLQALLLFPPMGRYIRGLETDMGFFGSMAYVEIRLILYFGPTVAFHAVRFLWSIFDLIVVVSLSLVVAFTTGPTDLRNRVSAIILPRVVKLIKYHNRYDLNIRGLFMHACEALIAPFDRWEIAIGQRRRNRRHPPLEPYQYHKLKKPRYIRLLRLKRRSFFSEPSCELAEFPLDEAPSFEAVSYTWGDEDPSIPVEVNGREILVTSAVDELLFYQRSIFTPNLFWIDAICINQEDKDEKSDQLPMMTDIYRRASRVVVWLGAPENRKDTRIVRKMIRALNWPETFIPTTALLPSLFDNEEQAFIAVGRLFSHPWFERAWIVQEVAVGKIVHVMYHGTCIDWDVLTAAAKRLGHDTVLKSRLLYHNTPKVSSTNTSDPRLGRSTTFNAVERIRWAHPEFLTRIRLSMEVGNILPLSLILVMTLPCKCKDPRDKVFAVLGIAKDGHNLPFKPNYKDDVDKVFLKTTAFVLSSEEWFLLFSIAGRGYESFNHIPRSQFMDRLPSWVPDYSSDTIAGTRPAYMEGIRSRDPAGKVTFTSDEKLIQLQVVAFDVIQRLGSKAKIHNSSAYFPNGNVPMDTFTAQFRQYMATSGDNGGDWYVSSRQLARNLLVSALKSQEAVDQDFWRLCMSQSEYIDAMGAVPTLYPPLSPEARRIFEHFLFRDPEPLMTRVEADREVLMILYLSRRFAQSTAGKAFCITAAGSMALVPPLSKEGDTLVHVRGGYIPIVLRRKRPGVRRADLVGTCVVQHVEEVYSGSDWENWLLE